MILKYERLYYLRGDVGKNIYLFTANSTLKSNGALVMGAGCAKSVRDIYENIDKQFGNKIEKYSIFGVCFVKYQLQIIGAFQTKVDWKDKSNEVLVRYSTKKLSLYANIHKDYTFHLPFPAITNGGLTVEDIMPIINSLPNNVIVYLDK